jgi:hypothetical protein
MSGIKFSFSGPRDDLIYILKAMAHLSVHSGQSVEEMVSSLVPRPVSDQAPPPPAPQLTPPQYDPTGLRAPFPPSGAKEVPLTEGQKAFLEGRIAPESTPVGTLLSDPVYPDLGAGGPQSSLTPSNPAPLFNPDAFSITGTGSESFDFGALALKGEAHELLVDTIRSWAEGFEDPDADQPDRLRLLKDLSESSIAIYVLRWLAEYGSLQAAIYAILRKELEGADTESEILDLIDRISANITQISHAVFPDIAGWHDYSTRWKRALLNKED